MFAQYKLVEAIEKDSLSQHHNVDAPEIYILLSII
jgi:hypothetical protein